jgi:glucose-6-phosphate isomerase
MSRFLSPPIHPMRIELSNATLTPEGPVLTRRLSDLEGLFRDQDIWRNDRDRSDDVVYTVHSSPVPEVPREVPQSITTIAPGTCGGEFFMTKGHQHPDPQGEIYLGLSGTGGLLLFDGEQAEYVEMAPGVIGYIPPGWAHRSINTGSEPYEFLAVYPGSAGHDYQWVLRNGMGRRVMQAESGYRLVPFRAQRDAVR